MKFVNDTLVFEEGEARIVDGCLIIEKCEVIEDGTDSETNEVL